VFVYPLKVRNDRDKQREKGPQREEQQAGCLPAPSASYRRRAWIEFQRALDPLAPIKPLPPSRQ
jgi:hypothetical protein